MIPAAAKKARARDSGDADLGAPILLLQDLALLANLTVLCRLAQIATVYRIVTVTRID